MGQVFFPLDDELALLPGRLTPQLQEHLTHLASWMPFARAAQMLERLLGVQVSEPTVRRKTLDAGTRSQVRQTSSHDASWQANSGGDKQVISVDGAYVPLIGGEWAEVRTLVIGEIDVAKKHQGKQETKVERLSSFSRLTDADTFGELAQGEMERRGVPSAKAVCAVMDGADWLQGFVDLHRPDAVRILDVPHAAHHLSQLIEALQQAGVRLPADVLPRSIHILKHRGPGLFVRWYDRLPPLIKEGEAVSKQEAYLRKRLSLMDYPTFQREGWPIGSGMVESANKLVVQARLKGAGMHWQRHHVNAMLTLRNAVCNERWSECWHEGVQQQQSEHALKRTQRAEKRWQEVCSSLLHCLLRSHPSTPAPLATPSPPVEPPVAVRSAEPCATLPGSSRPSPHHIWKRLPACRPKEIAKI
nr:ISKra4 family transposase [Tengunoibacter tsumagoiensis]